MAKKRVRLSQSGGSMSHPKLKKGPNMKTGSEAEEIGLIYGVRPDSVEEWRVAVALWNLGREFDFQVPFFGGHEVGGFIVDFVVYNGLDIPLEVIGEYWHRNVDEERHRAILLESEIGQPLRYLVTTLLRTQAEAMTTVSMALG